MTRNRLIVSILAIAGASTAALAQHDTKPAPAKPGDKPAMPGGMPEMTKEQQEMYAKAMAAATPGPMHEHLMRGVGAWDGQVKSYEMPGQPPQESTCVMTIKPMLGNRFTSCEVRGDMGGMGPFEGFGIYGYDNTSKKFQQTWADNFGTGMMTGTGELSADGKSMTWAMNYNDPMTGGPSVMREVETFTDENHSKLEMFGKDPASGKEMKMVEISFTRRMGGASPAGKPMTKPSPAAKPAGG